MILKLGEFKFYPWERGVYSSKGTVYSRREYSTFNYIRFNISNNMVNIEFTSGLKEYMFEFQNIDFNKILYVIADPITVMKFIDDSLMRIDKLQVFS